MRDISSVTEFRDFMSNLPAADDSAGQAATERNAQLTKPPGALGDLEDLAIWYARWSGQARPRIDAPQVVIFAGNHGVAAAGVSAFPPEVTQQMVYNFQAGGAAINQISKTFGAKMDVVALELDRPTQDFTQGPAMTESDLLSALQTGWRAVDPQGDLFVAGEMGIGNTTPAAAIAAALLGARFKIGLGAAPGWMMPVWPKNVPWWRQDWPVMLRYCMIRCLFCRLSVDGKLPLWPDQLQRRGPMVFPYFWMGSFVLLQLWFCMR